MITKNKLYILRKERELTQKEVAKKIGYSQSHYCHLEKSKRNPSLKVLKKLAEYFDVTIDNLFN